jgi:hypothetical protein
MVPSLGPRYSATKTPFASVVLNGENFSSGPGMAACVAPLTTRDAVESAWPLGGDDVREAVAGHIGQGSANAATKAFGIRRKTEEQLVRAGIEEPCPRRITRVRAGDINGRRGDFTSFERFQPQPGAP